MQLRKLAKDQDSKTDGCESVYLGAAGPCIVQGRQVDADTFANLENVLPGEVAVFIRPEVLIEAVQRLQEQR